MPNDPTIKDRRFSIQEVARQTGLSEYNLRFYEKEGLLRPVERLPESGHRRYSDQDVAWIRFLIRLRMTRMPIAKMRRYAELAAAGEATSRERRLLLEEHRVGVAAQMDQITQCLEKLDTKIATYHEIEARLGRADAGPDTPPETARVPTPKESR